MTLTLRLLCLTLTLGLIAVAAPADDEPRIERQLKIVDTRLGVDEELSLGELAIGETYQHFTDDGRELLVTRTESGYSVEIDGEVINVATGGGAQSIALIETGDGSENVDVKKRKIVHVHTSDDEVVIHGDHDGGAHVWIDAEDGVTALGEGTYAFRVGNAEVARKALEESGALDDLTDDQRQRILDALTNLEATEGERRVIRLKEKVEHEETIDN